MSEKASIDELASVTLSDRGMYNFLLMDVADTERVKTVLVGDLSCLYHVDIVKKFSSAILEHNLKVVRVRGGGIIRFGDERLEAYFTSKTYGPAPQGLVQELLEQYVLGKNLSIKLQVDMGTCK